MAAVAAHLASWKSSSDSTAKTSSGVAAYSIVLAIFMRLLLSLWWPAAAWRTGPVASVATSAVRPGESSRRRTCWPGDGLGGEVRRALGEHRDDRVAAGDRVVGQEHHRLPVGGTCTAPRTTPSLGSSVLDAAAARRRAGPSSRTPTRSLAARRSTPAAVSAAGSRSQSARGPGQHVEGRRGRSAGSATGATSTSGSPAGVPTGSRSPGCSGADRSPESVSFERDPRTRARRCRRGREVGAQPAVGRSEAEDVLRRAAGTGAAWPTGRRRRSPARGRR